MNSSNFNQAFFCKNDAAVSQYLLFTPSKFARECLLYPQEAGKLQAVRSYETGRANLDSYLFFIVLSGSGTFVYEGETYHLRAGDSIFIDCRRPYRQISSEELWTLQWVHFSGAAMPQIYAKYREHGGKPVFTAQYARAYQELLDQIDRTKSDGSYVVSMELAEKLTSLLGLLMKETLRQKHHRRSSKLDVAAVQSYLDSHYTEPVTLEKLSKEFFVDKFYLTKIFKAEYDTTINNYLNQVRITKAKELLRFTDRSIEEIGPQVGIPEPNYFSRIFKKIEGISPSVYRSMW